MSDLLNSASLVMIPSGYKEDIVYSEIPLDGSGDLQFTRSSNGTRINSAGLVEVCPWNLVGQSNTFSSSPWGNSGATLTSGQTDPNGGANAWKVELAAGSSYLYQPSILVTGVVTMSAYLRADSTTTIGFNDGSAYPNSVTIGTTWQRYEFSFNVTGSNTAIQFDNYFGVSPATLAKTFYIYGAQLNIGSTAKPYFPTTDRLNVPRLTYQNGGGGCPSLLLEKQSTNEVQYSQELDNAYWLKYQGSITANQGTSPDGTQNADLWTTSGSQSVLYRTGLTCNVLSYFAKAISLSSGSKFYIQVDGVGNAEWNQDGTLSSVSGGTATNGQNMGNGWFRFVYIVTSGNVANYGLNGNTSTSTALIWGLQNEAGTYPTSYIPTTSASATRVADVCSKTGIGALIGGTSGTVFFDIKTNPVLSSESYKQFCYYFDSASAQSYMYLSSTNLISTPPNWGSLSWATPFVGNTRYKVALTYAPNDFALYVNGVSVATASSGTPKNNVNIQIGQLNGTEMCEFVFNQYTHFPSRLTNAELAQLTTL